MEFWKLRETQCGPEFVISFPPSFASQRDVGNFIDTCSWSCLLVVKFHEDLRHIEADKTKLKFIDSALSVRCWEYGNMYSTNL